MHYLYGLFFSLLFISQSLAQTSELITSLALERINLVEKIILQKNIIEQEKTMNQELIKHMSKEEAQDLVNYFTNNMQELEKEINESEKKIRENQKQIKKTVQEMNKPELDETIDEIKTTVAQKMTDDEEKIKNRLNQLEQMTANLPENTKPAMQLQINNLKAEEQQRSIAVRTTLQTIIQELTENY